MRWLLLLAGCTASGSDPDTGATLPCPEGMAPVPAEDPLWCIDRYEAEVVGGIAQTVAGGLPTDEISYDDAKATCEATPILDASGAQVGFKHLATSAEWEDSADNLVGEGGDGFPYGDSWQDGICATALENGEAGFEDQQPSGSFLDCVSTFGVYDQTGNLWEWLDGDIYANAAAALMRFEADGVPVTEQADGSLSASGDLAQLRLQVIGVLPGEVSAVDGRLFVTADQISVDDDSHGYLTAGMDQPDKGWYPIQLSITDGGAWIDADPGGDGTAIPDKRGCAFYTGYGDGCNVHNANYYHPHDFTGTVGYRCASPPL